MHESMKDHPQYRFVSLSTLNHGEAVEKFQIALGQILEDMVDPNKSPDDKRKITLTFEFKANARKNGSRYGESTVKIGCTSKLGNFLSDESTLAISEGEDGPEAHQSVYQEGNMDDLFQNRNKKSKT